MAERGPRSLQLPLSFCCVIAMEVVAVALNCLQGIHVSQDQCTTATPELHVRLDSSMAGLSKLGLLFCKAIVQGEQALVGCHAAAAVPMLIGSVQH